MRDIAPVLFDRSMNMWVLTGYEACASVLRSDKFSAASGQRQRARSDEIPQTMLNTDGATHVLLRAPAAKAFSSRAISALAGTIGEAAEAVFFDLPPSGAGREIDLIEAVGRPFAAAVIGHLLGIGANDHRELRLLAEAASPNLDPLVSGPEAEKAALASKDLASFLGKQSLRSAATSPPHPVLEMLGDDRLDEVQKSALLSLVVIGGYDPLVNLIGNGVHLLSQWPLVHARLKAGPVGLVPGLVEEVLRMESPIPFTARVCTEPATVGGSAIPAGSMVLVHLGAANRDPAKFADPDEFRPERPHNAHLAFGGGAHLCLGAAAVRLAGSVMFTQILTSRPHIRRASPEVCWRAALVPRGLETLAVDW
jgi:cytochrome P450